MEKTAGADEFLEIQGNKKPQALSAWLMILGWAYAGMHVLPAFLKQEVKAYLTAGDLLSFAIPGVVLSIAWKLSAVIGAGVSVEKPKYGRVALVLLFFSSILYAQGQGMNLAANAIARGLAGRERTAVFWLDYFFDERLGHLFWHAGILGLSAGLVVQAASLAGLSARWPVWAGAPPFAFAYFTDGVEGQTVVFLFPGAVLLLAAILVWARSGRRAIGTNAVMLFFFLGFALAAILFTVWWLWRGGFPQFSELGWV